MSRYALVEVRDLREAAESMHLPRFRRTFDDVDDVLAAIRSDRRDRGVFVATDPETGAIEEWSRDACIAVPMAEVLATTPVVLPESVTRGSYRVFHVSPRGRRFATSFYLHDTLS